MLCLRTTSQRILQFRMKMRKTWIRRCHPSPRRFQLFGSFLRYGSALSSWLQTHRLQNLTLDPTLPSPIAKHTTPLVSSPALDGFQSVDFKSSDIAMLKSPTTCINDTCTNGCIPILLSKISPSSADRHAIFSTYDLPFFRQSPTDERLWRTMSRTQFWRKDTWIIPIHRSSGGGHWVLCVIRITRRELLLFDSFGHLGQRAWDADVTVCFPTSPVNFC